MPGSEDEAVSGTEASKTVTLTEKDLRDAARLFRLLADPAMAVGGYADLVSVPSGTKDRDVLISRARIVLNSRRLRERFFSRIMFGEPAWDILLLLYASEQSSARLTVSRLAEWVEAPPTTVARWVKFLEEEQLVKRTAHPTDRRTIFISLMDKGRTALDSYLGMIPG